MASASDAGQASAPEGSLSPGLRKLVRGSYNLDKPFLELEVRMRNVDFAIEFDDLGTKLADQIQSALGLEPLEEAECPTSQAREEGLGFEWTTIDFCLGRWVSDVHVHGHIVSGGNTAGVMYRMEVSFVKVL
jgi:hypothetical protein